MTRNRVYLDSEFTNLAPLQGDVIEVAWAVNDGPVRSFPFLHTLAGADQRALEVNKYFERGFGHFYTDNVLPSFVEQPCTVETLNQFKQDLMGATLVAENYGIDWIKLFQKIGFEPWFYRKIELSSVALAVFDLDEPESLHATAERLREFGGYDIPEATHAAADDVECLRACYLALRELRTRLHPKEESK